MNAIIKMQSRWSGILSLLVLVGIAGCGGGGGGSGGDGAPAAPTALSATTLSESSIRIDWNDASPNETGFYAERSVSPSGPWTQLTLAGNTESATDTGLGASVTYYYRVAAYNASGASPYVGPVTATTFARPTTIPIAPSGLVATSTASGNGISLSWNDHADNEAGFRIERAANSAGPFTEIVAVGAGSTTYSDTGLAASTTYHYRVRAYNGAGSSAYSNPASATTQTVTTIPTSPSNFTAMATSSSSIRLSWTDTSNNETGFKIDRSTASTGPWSQIATTSAGVVVYSNTGLTESTRFYYRVRASNSAGDSTPSNVANATTAPAAPINVVATALSGTSISLSWTDNSSGEFGFAVERALAMTGPFSIVSVMPGPGPVTVGTNVTTYTDTGLSLSTTYYYRVRAVGLGGSSSSTVASATTLATLPQTRIRIINNASPALLLKDVVRLKLALNVNGFSDADLLSDDRFTSCQSMDNFSYIQPGGSSTFNQTIGPNYWVFISMGVWQTDLFNCSTSSPWTRRTSFVNPADPLRLNYVFAQFDISGHTGGIVDLAISGSYLNGSLKATLSQDGVVFGTVPFQIITQ